MVYSTEKLSQFNMFILSFLTVLTLSKLCIKMWQLYAGRLISGYVLAARERQIKIDRIWTTFD